MNRATVRSNAPDPVQVFRALGHPARLQMTEALGGGERCVAELKDLVGLSWSTVSRHLAQLHAAGIVRAEKRGNQVVYSLALPCVTKLTQCLQAAAAKGRRSKCGPAATEPARTS